MKEGGGNSPHPLPFPMDRLGDAPVQMGNGSQNSTIKERKRLRSRWAPACSPEECADYSGTGLWQSLNTITKQREMIKSVTRVSANSFKKVVGLKRKIWRMRGSEHSWSQPARPPGQQTQGNVAGALLSQMPFQTPQVSGLNHDGRG